MSLEKELRDAAGKATPGPWRSAEWTTGTYPYEVFDPQTQSRVCAGSKEANAAFIALANPANILALLDKLERMEKALEPFANVASELPESRRGAVFGYNGATITAEELRAARAALKD